jgi:hypothetical protein
MNFETRSINHGTQNKRKHLIRAIPQGFSSTCNIAKKGIFGMQSSSPASNVIVS